MGSIKPFAIGFLSCALISAIWFSSALYSGQITRGEAVLDVEQYLPRGVRETPARHINSDTIDRLARQP